MDNQISDRRFKSLDRMDAMPAELRDCVHEFGLVIVEVLVKHGVRSPKAIREIVKEIWLGPRQEGQKNDAATAIDWLLCQSGNMISAKTFYRMLAENNMTIVKVEPTRAMIEASLAEVSGHNIRCTKQEKHTRRLRAALRAAMQQGEFQRLRLSQDLQRGAA
jgi:hypothetical protein